MLVPGNSLNDDKSSVTCDKYIPKQNAMTSCPVSHAGGGLESPVCQLQSPHANSSPSKQMKISRTHSMMDFVSCDRVYLLEMETKPLYVTFI